ncbi:MULTISPECIES: SusC/RagA family TonB-linked outer membrane protein [Dyadobacter]|uniref:SusC/RagA family TonB-linked outer membrane protein n=1 Tax=Dyadobacter chenhuakuii TaxID=2909339 RepID=A0A9X1QC10_9BACT|nr:MULTISPECIES: SusC/RagA family TonB-linked outer membrane protein [Dyadobacter]MCF2499048.1 SusC/RagA family TonB-linked outer membrane protein [Dyadobacter chenhuakuii]MCF2517631.1 SusC/RagA family TonB-linked outer membrane protein [Dyadobacter sp. CY351]
MKFNITRLKVLLSLAGVCLAMALQAQSGRLLTGKVISEDDKQPLPNVTVLLKGKSVATETSVDGDYSIQVSGGDVVQFRMVGYVIQEVPAGAAATLDIVLKPDVSSLNEVVVTGYGSASRTKITSSIAKLDAKVLETGMRSNPAQALAGTIAGVRVSTATGRPGSVATITLRGGTNFDGSGSPLIVVDGQVRGSLSDINPDDIESMEVLKDASATAIYGARASNGVVLITSKRGKAGSSSITFKSKTGINFLNVPYDYLNAEDYIKWTRMGVVEAIKNGVTTSSLLSGVGPRGTGNLYKDANGNILDGNYDSRAIWSTMRLTDQNRELLSANDGWKTMKDPIKTNEAGAYDPNGTNADLIYKGFNYGDYAFKSPAISQDYNIGMNGGNEKGGYYANLGYYNEDGLSLGTFYRRLTFTLNGDYKIKSWLKSESSLAFARANWRDQSLQNGEANYWGRMLSAPPTMRGTNANGELILGRDANDGNPSLNLDKYKRRNQSDKFTLGQAFKVDFSDDLFLRVGGILMYDEAEAESFNRDFRIGIMSATNPNTGWNRDRASSAGFDRTIRQTYNAILNYKKSFLGKSYIDAMAGFEYYDEATRGFSAAGRLAPTDDFQDLGLTINDANTRSIDSYHTQERIISGFARLNYDYDGKYLASFTVRRDGYSRLIGDNQFGTFPAFSAGWLVHKEEFMASTQQWLSFLKLRASYGKNGNIGIGTNNGIGVYELQGAYNSQIPYNGSIGFLQTGVANPNLKWEKSNTVEAGVEMGFFNNRITTNIAVYNRVTTDKIASVLLPTSAGVTSIRTNNGSMRNRGVELEGIFKAVQKQDFTVQIGANAAYNKNLVLKLPFNGNANNRQGGQRIYDPRSGNVIWAGGLQEGQEPGEIFGYVSDGIIRTGEDLDKYNKIDIAAGEVQYGASAGKRVASNALINSKNLNRATYISTQLGDMMWKDLDQNDTIDTRDMVSLGRTIPRWTGGFNTTIRWKNLSLFARMDFALGHKQMDFQQMWSLGSFQGEFNATEMVKETWTPDNPDAKYPRYTWADQLNSKNFDRPSSMFWVNSSYLAFREVSLSYTVPSSLLQRAKIAGLTFTATGQNLGYVTNKMLSLPERTGSQNSAYTIPTTLILGANFTF